MRVAIVNWNRRLIGGCETYLQRLIPALRDRGHQIGFWCEFDQPTDRSPVFTSDSIPIWCAAQHGWDMAIDSLRSWRPDLLYAHGLTDVSCEQMLLGIAPGILFAHAYYGTCISGAKRFQVPRCQPCHRRFGWLCLLHFYPRRCGGLNPLVMWSEYQKQRTRLRLLRQYRIVAVASRHMENEYRQHGISPERIERLPLFVDSPAAEPSLSRSSPRELPHRLVFLGRMEREKGGHLLLEALPELAQQLGRSIHLRLAGDGRTRMEWETLARGIQGSNSRIKIDFVGWVNREQREQLLLESDLLVMPSVWPEPFGLIGIEAAALGLPSAAFDVGGVSDWLSDAVNGRLAPGNPPTAAGLAGAMGDCLKDPDQHHRLREGAVRMARSFTLANHLQRLEPLFARVVENAHASPQGAG